MRASRSLSVAVDNVRWGVRGGLFFGLAYSAIALVLYALRGRESFEANGVTLGSLVAAYVLGALAAGIVVGLLRPLLRWQLGAMAVGVAAAVPACVGIGLARFGAFSGWSGADMGTVVVMGVMFGMLFGNQYWNNHSRRDSEIE
jgi:hypothetical protein